jgi:hypothetical protein
MVVRAVSILSIASIDQGAFDAHAVRTQYALH